MNEIIKQRRLYKTVQKEKNVKKMVKNPQFDQYDSIDQAIRGNLYDVPKYIEVELPKLVSEKRSRIQYQFRCEQCKNKYWVSRRDSRFCSPMCRKQAFLERQMIGEATETPTATDEATETEDTSKIHVLK